MYSAVRKYKILKFADKRMVPESVNKVNQT